jgi:hypothetical protein
VSTAFNSLNLCFVLGAIASGFSALACRDDLKHAALRRMVTPGTPKKRSIADA